MKCLKCGVENANEAKFCVGCGVPLVEEFNNNGNDVVKDSASFPFVQYCVNILLKPYETFKKNEENLNNPKNSIILTIIVTLLASVATLIGIIISMVRVPSFNVTNDISTGHAYYYWDFAQLKNIQFLKTVFASIFIYAVIIGGIALVFYLGSIMIKKKANFFKLLGIIAGSMIPFILGLMLRSIFSIIWIPLGSAFEKIGLLYTLIILYELINLELNLPTKQKIYFNLICFSILLIGGNFIYD